MRLNVFLSRASVLGISFLLALAGVSFAQGSVQEKASATLNTEDLALIQKAEDDVKNNLHLAGIHTRMGLNCAVCHGADSKIPDDTASVEDKACTTCHGTFEALSAKTPEGALNVHGSHLGPEIECVACHQGHEQSEAYCVNCHTNFDLAIPGGKK